MIYSLVTLIVNALRGLLGYILKPYFEDWFNRKRKVICSVSQSWTDYDDGDPTYENSSRQVRMLHRHTKISPIYGRRYFSMRCDNKKDIPVTLENFKVVFFKGENLLVELQPRFSPSGKKIEEISLSPKEPSKTYTIQITAQRDELRKVKEADKTKLISQVAGHEEICATLPHWTDLK